MGFTLKALVANKSTTMSPPEIYLVSFGIAKGEEVVEYGTPDGVLTGVREKFKALEKSKKGQKKPMTLSWFPSSEKRTLFKELKNKKLNITVFVEQGKNRWTFRFLDFEILGHPKPDPRKFSDHTRTDERIDGVFKIFEDDPNG